MKRLNTEYAVVALCRKGILKSIAGLALIASLPFLAGCSDDNDREPARGDGSPAISVASVSPALMGDSITLNVNCTDADVALSTLQAQLYYSGERVEQTTIRTKENGNYRLKLFVPIFKNVPDGTAKLHLTLQNIYFTKVEQVIDLPVSRPHYSSLQLAAGGNTYTMLPDAANPYLFKCTVSSPNSKTLPGYIKAPSTASNTDGVTFGQGTSGVTQGSTDPISFVNTARGSFECTFNVLTYAYSPVYDPATAAQEITFSASALEYDGEFIQGRNYEFVGISDVTSPTWWHDTDFFTANGDGTYRFKAVSGTYHIKANTARQGFQVWATKADKSTASLNADGTGAVWIIGNDGFAKPDYSFVNGQSWWTDTDHALCMAQVSDRKYQITLTVGKQLRPTDVNFKFFGQAGWGIEFKGDAAEYHVTSISNVFQIGSSANGHAGDNGNIFLDAGTTLTVGDTYVFTLDLTAGVANAVLSVAKQ